MEGGFILTLTCDDRVGIVAAVASALAAMDGFILDSQQYADLETGRFFMRVAFVGSGARFPADRAAVAAALDPVATRFAFDWQLAAVADRPRVMIAVSKGSHCLNDLLHRWRTGTLPVEIAGVVSNHDSLRALVEWHGLPWHHLPVDDASRDRQERAILDLMAAGEADYLVLARYMQVLGPVLVDALPGRCINIHHSFLPGFKGAQPYHRAAIDDLIRIGRDIEAQVLARAVAWVGERRVFLNGNRTLVFR